MFTLDCYIAIVFYLMGLLFYFCLVTIPDTMSVGESDSNVTVCATVTTTLSADLDIILSTSDGTGLF